MLKKVQDPHALAGFLVLEEGNRVEGFLQEPRVSGVNDKNEARGSLIFQTTEPGTKISLDNVVSVAAVGDFVGVTISSATRVLMAEIGKLAAVTFVGFGKAKPGQKPYQRYIIELDDGLPSAS
jgi:hypothetical protein